jgi:hypothetical protein
MEKNTWKDHYRQERLYKKYGFPVERGAEWLDEKEPGWANKINIETLDIGLSDSCICGQLFVDRIQELAVQNGYQYAISKYFKSSQTIGWPSSALSEMANLGFAMSVEQESTPDETVWEYLTIYWVAQIEKRLANSGDMLPTIIDEKVGKDYV